MFLKLRKVLLHKFITGIFSLTPIKHVRQNKPFSLNYKCKLKDIFSLQPTIFFLNEIFYNQTVVTICDSSYAMVISKHTQF